MYQQKCFKPGQCGSVGWSILQSCGFNFQSGHMPRLGVQSPVGVSMESKPTDVSLSFSVGIEKKKKKKSTAALAGVAQWIKRGLQTKGSLVRFPVRAHAWVAGQLPIGGHVRGNHTLMFLSLSFSLPNPLYKNK